MNKKQLADHYTSLIQELIDDPNYPKALKPARRREVQELQKTFLDGYDSREPEIQNLLSIIEDLEFQLNEEYPE